MNVCFMHEYLSFSQRLTEECVEASIEHAIREGQSLLRLSQSGIPVIKCSIAHFNAAKKMPMEKREDRLYKLESLRGEIQLLLSLAKAERMGKYSDHPFLNSHQGNGKMPKK